MSSFLAIAGTVAGTALTLAAALYAFAALLCRGRSRASGKGSGKDGGNDGGSGHRASAQTGAAPVPVPVPVPMPVPVSVLKPLCGPEPGLEANLATFCMQSHPRFQLVFGVRDPFDPAIAVVERLRQRFPAVEMRLVADPRIHGANLKVSNLINMMRAARHPWLVLADSDIAVGPDYLERVTAPLLDPGVGIVTCLYHARARGADGRRGIPWPRLGALFIDTWFAPSVRVASSAGSSAFAFGATIALRADTLRAIGGFDALKDRLADDFRLGELTRRLGLRTVLSDVRVGTDVTETTLRALWSRERRWMQTIRSLNPAGYAFSFITFTLPMLALGLWLAPTPFNLAVALSGAAARLGLHWRQPAPGVPAPGHALHAPLRDCLLLLEWLSGFAGASVRWRRQRLRIDTRRDTRVDRQADTPRTQHQ